MIKVHCDIFFFFFHLFIFAATLFHVLVNGARIIKKTTVGEIVYSKINEKMLLWDRERSDICDWNQACQEYYDEFLNNVPLNFVTKVVRLSDLDDLFQQITSAKDISLSKINSQNETVADYQLISEEINHIYNNLAAKINK